jgi:hypothetical protein
MNKEKQYGIVDVPEGMNPEEFAKQNGGISFRPLPFGPFVVQLQVPDNIVTFLKDEGKKLEDEHLIREKLAGHLEREFQYPEEVKNKFADMAANIFTGYREAHKQYFYLDQSIEAAGDNYEDFKPTMWLENLWINYMRENEYNPPHTHTGALSFVIYLNTLNLKDSNAKHMASSPPPGWIQFQNELGGNEETWKVTQQTYAPMEGNMFIFPASLNHSVYPFREPGLRMSVSGNIHYTNRDKWPKYFF